MAFLEKPDFYAGLPAESAGRLDWFAKEIIKMNQKAMAAILRQAEYISGAYELCQELDRPFSHWVAEKLPISLRTAYNRLEQYQVLTRCKVLSNLPDNAKLLIDSTAYTELAKPDTPQKLITAVANTAGNGEKVSAKEIRAMRRKLGLPTKSDMAENGAHGSAKASALQKNGNPDEEETELAESDRDAENRPIPPELSDVFRFRGIMNRQLRAIAVLMTWVQVAKSDPATSAVQMNQLFFQLRDAKETLLVGLPHAVCPYCKGKGCKSEPANRVWCQGRGWLIKDQWAGIPEERRK